MLSQLRQFLDKLERRQQRKRHPSVRSAQSIDDLQQLQIVFLITPGRSGTLSLVEYCSQTTSMYCEHAATPWLASVGYRFHRGRLSAEAAQWSYYACREKYLQTAYETGRSFLDGDCKNLPLLPALANFFPNARFLHIVRKPEKFVMSAYRRGYYQRLPAELWGHLEPESESDINAPVTAIEKAAFFWNEANTIAEKMKSDLSENRIRTLVSEHFFNKPELILDALGDLGISCEIKTNQAPIEHLNKQVKNPVDRRERESDISKAVEKFCPTQALYYPDL